MRNENIVKSHLLICPGDKFYQIFKERRWIWLKFDSLLWSNYSRVLSTLWTRKKKYMYRFKIVTDRDVDKSIKWSEILFVR